MSADTNARERKPVAWFRPTAWEPWQPRKVRASNFPTGGNQDAPQALVGKSAPTLPALEASQPQQAPTQRKTRIIIKSAKDVNERAVSWLWKPFLARGVLHILAGESGAGKSTIAFSLAARISSGEQLPDGSAVEAANVLIWTAEDDLETTVKPRLSVANANMSNIAFIVGSEEPSLDWKERAFNPTRDMDDLSEALETLPSMALLIIDPITAVVSGDGNKNVDVRRGLQPLLDLAKKHNIAILGISHFSKGTAGRKPLERMTGSLAFGAVSRINFFAVKPNQDDGNRVFAIMQSNIGPDKGGFEYDIKPHNYKVDGEIIETTRVEWYEPTTGTAAKILADIEIESEKPNKNQDIEKAMVFLRDNLKQGPVEADEIKRHAKDAHITNYALEKAKRELGVVSKKQGLNGWVWQIPLPTTPLNFSQ